MIVTMLAKVHPIGKAMDTAAIVLEIYLVTTKRYICLKVTKNEREMSIAVKLLPAPLNEPTYI